MRKLRIKNIIKEAINPEVLVVENESHMHSVPKNSETHFKLTIVANAFTNKSKIQRHRQINDLLSDEFKNGPHALSMHLYTIDEWQQKKIPDSPKCKGGSLHDK